MKVYNFTDSSISWFSSYLLDRFQCVQIESSFSPFLPVPYGVPQGSILGPLLFLLFINELPDLADENDGHEEPSDVGNDSIIVYADDNTPTTADEDPTALQRNAQKQVDCVTDWFATNEMICSSDKTKLLVIGTKANRDAKLENENLVLGIDVCGEHKKETKSEKLLGVVVNNVATWKNHLHGDDENVGLLKQLSMRVGMLKKLGKLMPTSKLKTLMFGLFQSKLIYCITVWGRVWNIPGSLDQQNRKSTSLTKEDVRKLQVLQNKCLRLLTKCDYRTPTATMIDKTNLLSVHQLTAHLSLTQVFNIHQTKLPTYHYERLFQPEKPPTRSAASLPAKRTEFVLSQARTSFFYQSSRLWTALPLQIKQADNKLQFKKKSRTWVKENIDVKPI